MATIFTVTEIELALRNTGGLHSRAAKALSLASKDGRSITRQGVANRISRSPRLQAAMLDITEEIKDLAEDRLIRNLKAGKERTINWYLATKARDRGYSQSLSLNGGTDENGRPISLTASGPTVLIYIPDNGRDPSMIDVSPPRIANKDGSTLASGLNAGNSDP